WNDNPAMTPPEMHLKLRDQPPRNSQSVVRIYYVHSIFPLPTIGVGGGLTYPGSSSTTVISGRFACDTTLAHELGHQLGLGHASGWGSGKLLMKEGIHDNSLLTPDEIARARRNAILYAPHHP